MLRAMGRLALGAVLLFLAILAFGAEGEVPVPKLTGHVVDLTGTLTAGERDQLDARLRDFEARKGSQVVVLLVPSIGTEVIEDFAGRVTDAWQLGRKGVDDGVLFVIAKQERKMRIHTGRGVQGTLTDILAKRIVADIVAPRFRTGDFAGGINEAADAIMKAIEGESLPLPEKKPTAGDGRFRLFAVKAYADGALGSRGAALLEPYADDAGNRGLLRTTPDTLELIAKRCLERGYALCVHAIGDRGNRIVLDAMERAAAASSPPVELPTRRFRIEHAQVLSLDDIPRFASLGVIASMQPTHCTSDMPWAPARLGTQRVEGAYAWRRLLNAGARLALGSDFPVEDANPLLGLYAAVTTQDVKGQPPGGYRPTEKLTIWEALRGFTSDAAYAASAERELGVAEPGYRADLAVFDRDLGKIPAREIPKARCVMTMVGGEIVWKGGK